MNEKTVYLSNMNSEYLIKNLASLRRSKGLTQQDIGDVIGSNKSMVSRFERQVHSPTFNTLKNYIEALGCDFKVVLMDKQGDFELKKRF